MEQSFESLTSPRSSIRGLQKTVIDGIGRTIVGGRILPGEFLPTEPELGATYSVSRTSVREAMRVLSAKGLVEIRQKIGTRVQESDRWNIFDSDILRWHHEEGQGDAVMLDLIELRQILEPAAAKLAASRAKMDHHRRMKASIEAMRLQLDNPEGFARADLDFHLAVYAASQNALMLQFGTVVGDFLGRVFMIQQQAVRGRNALELDIQLHNEVYEAINRGDGELASENMLAVVLDGKNSLIKALKSNVDSKDASRRAD
jgi:GntR family transcriptional regulator, galactonate operon transcriptional repressor